jgi:flagellar assembly factor FliW
MFTYHRDTPGKPWRAAPRKFRPGGPKCIIVPGFALDSAHTPIRFPFGLPGFEEERRFQLVEHTRLAPLILLQSETTAELCFLTLPLRAIAPDYDLAISEADCEILGLEPAQGPASGVLGLAIVTVPENGPATANLMAPLIVNLAAGAGVQMVRADQRYSHQHPLGETACS